MASYLTIQPLKEGDVFPVIYGKTLAGHKIILPNDLRGRICIMIFYFYQEARPQVQTWYNTFLDSYEKNKDIICLEVPMFRDYARFYSFLLDRRLRWIVPRKKHENVVLYYGKLEKYYYHFNVNNLTDSYVFMLDKEGKVITSVCGEVDEAKLQQIHTKLADLTTHDQLST